MSNEGMSFTLPEAPFLQHYSRYFKYLCNWENDFCFTDLYNTILQTPTQYSKTLQFESNWFIRFDNHLYICYNYFIFIVGLETCRLIFRINHLRTTITRSSVGNTISSSRQQIFNSDCSWRKDHAAWSMRLNRSGTYLDMYNDSLLKQKVQNL